MKNNSLQAQTESEVLADCAVAWKDVDEVTHRALANRDILNRELYLAEPFREGNHYPRQRNYHGFYCFAQTGRLVWHESLLEASVLSYLDLHEDIVAIAAQPMELSFADSTIHIPDFLALHGDRRQVVYDVKPPRFMTATTLEQFEKTRQLCKAVGWDYEVHTGFPRQVEINLAWVGAFRHPGFHPGEDALTQLLSGMDRPTTVGAASRILNPASIAKGRSGLYHLIATRWLAISLTKPISDRTIVERNSNAHA